MRGGGAGEKLHYKEANVAHGAAAVYGAGAAGKGAAAKTSFLNGLLLYVVLPVLVLYFVVIAASQFYNPRCSPEGNAMATHFVVANNKPNNASSATSLNASSSSTPPPPAAPASKTRLTAEEAPTGLRHIVFGIGASARTWDQRRGYAELWWRPDQIRGHVWLEEHPVSL